MIVPAWKLGCRISQLLDSFSACCSAPLVDFQSLIGTLQFACKVVVPGRTFLLRMIYLTSGVPSRFHHIRMNKQFQWDITMWNVLEGTLIYFASYLAHTVPHCTIKIYLAAVRNLHIVSGCNDPLQGKLLVKKILRGILRYQGCSRISRQPVTPPPPGPVSYPSRP